nr:hypothetical protein [Methanobacterium formicicum]
MDLEDLYTVAGTSLNRKKSAEYIKKISGRKGSTFKGNPSPGE